VTDKIKVPSPNRGSCNNATLRQPLSGGDENEVEFRENAFPFTFCLVDFMPRMTDGQKKDQYLEQDNDRSTPGEVRLL
jgi:hypothetical protein